MKLPKFCGILKIKKIILLILFTISILPQSDCMEEMERINDKVEKLLSKQKVTKSDVKKIEEYMERVEEWRDNASERERDIFDANVDTVATITSISHSYRQDPSMGGDLKKIIKNHIP